MSIGKVVAIAVSVLVIGGGLAYLVVSSLGEGMVYYKTVDELFSERDRFEGQEVRINGQLVEGSLQRKTGTDQFRFEMAKNGEVLVVSYQGIIPDTVKPGSEILVQGVLTPGEKRLIASEILTKCPSKYEEEARAKNLR